MRTCCLIFFFSSRRRHTRLQGDWSSDVCSSDLPEGAVVLDAGSAPTHLFVIIKGHVVQTEGDEVLASYGPDDSFDGRALVAGRTGSRFTVAEELFAYQFAPQTVGERIRRTTALDAL